MRVSKSKEIILKKIRDALIEPTPVPFIQSEGNSNLFVPPHDDLAVIFAEEFTKLDGKFIYAENQVECAALLVELLRTLKLDKLYCAEEELKDILLTNGHEIPFHPDLSTCDASLTSCAGLVARTGTLVLSSDQHQGRTASVYSPVHICIAFTGQLVYDTIEALQFLKEKYRNQLPSLLSFASGPSRTADIEKTLVKGIHGPKEVFCILVEQK
jgi:L-lactate dehydrogenase complex protein LldG